MPEDRDLNALIERALSTYAKPEPGLEERILLHLSPHRALREQRGRVARRQWLVWTAVPLATACLLALAFLSRPWLPVSHTPAPQRNEAARTVQPQVIPQAPRKPVPQPQRRVNVPRSRHDRSPLRVAMPKKDVFPMPQPLAPEEQALVHLVQQAPADQVRSLLAAQQSDAAPVQISSISIAPIEWPEAKN